jgi:hypothetical protein
MKKLTLFLMIFLSIKIISAQVVTEKAFYQVDTSLLMNSIEITKGQIMYCGYIKATDGRSLDPIDDTTKIVKKVILVVFDDNDAVRNLFLFSNHFPKGVKDKMCFEKAELLLNNNTYTRVDKA